MQMQKLSSYNFDSGDEMGLDCTTHYVDLRSKEVNQDILETPSPSFVMYSKILPSNAKNSTGILTYTIYLTSESAPLITNEECIFVIDAAEKYSSNDAGGWSTARHYAVPTTDIPVHLIPEVNLWFKQILRNKIIPMLFKQYPGIRT